MAKDPETGEWSAEATSEGWGKDVEDGIGGFLGGIFHPLMEGLGLKSKPVRVGAENIQAVSGAFGASPWFNRSSTGDRVAFGAQRFGQGQMGLGLERAQQGVGMIVDAYNQQLGTRGDQLAQLSLLRQAASDVGGVPSGANARALAAVGNYLGQQSALSGGAGLGAQMQAYGGAAGQAANQFAAQRAGEQAQARGLLGGTLAGIRGNDIQSGQLGALAGQIGIGQMGAGSALTKLGLDRASAASDELVDTRARALAYQRDLERQGLNIAMANKGFAVQTGQGNSAAIGGTLNAIGAAAADDD